MILKLVCDSITNAERYNYQDAAYTADSGLDLFFDKDMVVKAGSTTMIGLGIRVSAWSDDEKDNLPWMLMPRSSISKTPLRLANSIGLIDAGYRGEVMVCVDNIRNVDYQIMAGDKLFQAVAFDGMPVRAVRVNDLDFTDRGEKNFGSSNKKSLN